MRWFGAAILATCVTVTGVGLAMGLYLNRTPEAPMASIESANDRLTPVPALVLAVDTSSAPDAVATSSALETVATSPSPSLVPAVEAVEAPAAPPAQSSPPEASLAAEPPALAPLPPVAVEPQSGTSTSEPASESKVAAATAPAIPAPPHPNAASRYWVEYAVFARQRSAEHLRQKLAALHLEAQVVATHARDGHRLWRVRSAMADRPGADAGARLAQRLGIKPLLHRTAPHREPRVQYWVQFGAFPAIAPAIRLQRVLTDNGVKASVRTTRTSTGKPLFLVRSDGFPNRQLATLVGELGGSAANVAFLVGRNPPSRHVASHHPSARGAAGSSMPRQRHVPRAGG